MNALGLYGRYIMISMRSQMQYRGSFLLQTVAHFLVTGSEFLGLVVLFQRFGNIRGWTLPQVGLFYGMVSVAFASAESVARAFDSFDRMVRTGDFDRMLVRPRSTVLQMIGLDFRLSRLGRFSQGLFVLLWAAGALEVHWSAATVGLLVAAIGGGVCLFSGLFVMQATICFWTIDSIEIVNCTTYGGVEAAQFPLSIYRPWFRVIFTFVIPLATINYFPAQIILGKSEVTGLASLLLWLSPLAGVAFLLVSLLGWRVGVRHYCSTGS